MYPDDINIRTIGTITVDSQLGERAQKIDELLVLKPLRIVTECSNLPARLMAGARPRKERRSFWCDQLTYTSDFNYFING